MDEMRSKMGRITLEITVLVRDHLNGRLLPSITPRFLVQVLQVDRVKMGRSQKKKIHRIHPLSSASSVTLLNPGDEMPRRKPIDAYLRRIGQVPLLSREEEVRLAKRIEEGRYRIAMVLSKTSLDMPEIVRPCTTGMGHEGSLEPDAWRAIQEDPAATGLDAGTALGDPLIRRSCQRFMDLVSRMEAADAELARVVHSTGLTVKTLLRRLKTALESRKEKETKIGRIEMTRRQAGVLSQHIQRIRQELEEAASGAGVSLPVLRALAAELRSAKKLEEDARNAMIESNLRLVVHVAKQFIHHRASLLDLIQEGNIGLIRAVDGYDYRRGFRFSTYATWWIRQSMGRSIMERSHMIRIPVHRIEAVRRLNKTLHRLALILHRTPGLDEIAEEMGVTEDHVMDLMKMARDPVSYETPLGTEEGTPLLSFIENSKSPNPYDESERNELLSQTIEALANLTPREETVLRLRFGIGGAPAETLTEIGLRFGLTRERIRQIESEALRKLLRQAKHLRSYLEV